MSDIIFLTICFIIDFIFSSLFPSDFSMLGLIICPCAAFCGLLCITKKKRWYQGICQAFIVGLISDFFSVNAVMTFSVIYIVVYLVMKIWDKHLSSSLIEQAILLLSTIFVKEGLLYLTQRAAGSIKMSLETWLFHRCVPTLVGNIFIILIVLGLFELKKSYDDIQENNKRKEESMFWKMFK